MDDNNGIMTYMLSTKNWPQFAHWDTPPAPFNLDARPGLSQAVSQEYCEWSNANPNHGKSAGKRKYASIYERLRPLYPSYREKHEDVKLVVM